MDLSREARVDESHNRVAQIELEAVRNAFERLGNEFRKPATDYGHVDELDELMKLIVSDLESRTPQGESPLAVAQERVRELEKKIDDLGKCHSCGRPVANECAECHHLWQT